MTKSRGFCWVGGWGAVLVAAYLCSVAQAADVTRFTFRAVALTNSVFLRWSDPHASGFGSQAVHIRSGWTRFPETLGEKELRYEGTNTTFAYHDIGLILNETRYYTIWTSHDGLTFFQPRSVARDFLVVDLSAGPDASNYPITHMTAPPAGGWTDEYKTTKMVLRRIPAGTHVMGSPEDEYGRDDHEGHDETQHGVTLTEDFYIGVFPVTQKQWERVMGTWPSFFHNPSYRDARPVEQVNYDMIRGSDAGTNWPADNAVDANSFMGRLRARTGRTFDLPTESQWEYAGRAGRPTALNSGSNLTEIFFGECPHMSEVGRYWYNGGGAAEFPAGGGYDPNAPDSAGTAKVGSYRSNTWGLYDIHGNVNEWCLDWGGDYPETHVTDPRGPASGITRILRGGRWDNFHVTCRAASRHMMPPDSEGFTYGFRVALPTHMVQVAGGTLPCIGNGELNVDTFLISRYPVTWGEWKRVRAWAAENGYDIGDRGDGCEVDENPVHSLNWYDAVKWCNARSEMEARTPAYLVNGNVYRSGESIPSVNPDANGYRLPASDEWEYAARGGQNSEVEYTYSGSDDMDEVGWYNLNSGGAACPYTEDRGLWPVGQKLPNELWLYDMSGNVWEWCCYGGYDARTLRGGSWNHSAVSVAVNLWYPRDHEGNQVGLRVVLPRGR